MKTVLKKPAWSFLTMVMAMVLIFFSKSAESQNPQPLQSTFNVGRIKVDQKKGTIALPAEVNMAGGIIEVLLCTPFGKTHESLLTTSITPVELQTALLLLGSDPANEFYPPDQSFMNPEAYLENDSIQQFIIFLEYNDETRIKRVRAEQMMFNPLTGKKYKRMTWFFKGLQWDENGKVISGNQITLISTYFNSYSVMCLFSGEMLDDTLFSIVDGKLIKKAPVKVIIQRI